ncbi:hypothetical protein A1O7_03686 [Cladophialophora yegresii CBS 114405]|uniref:Uncharacterized protein n=1 Tax=Cladophialophora yegresii CBS 114405 TaxID=1182544 RepID=W9WYA7_9EURO|nr:uncharacterized protein A1O7_03686 [Cladophialophora yegresii CBS 114405]EXJ63239.1 hypothetical protein A1O7_03686 [Cladophialophora yegresii CBS 114405]
MPESLLWINKDTGSTVLSRSSRAETKQIRKHVQHERQVRAKAEAAARPAPTSDKSPRKRRPKDRPSPEQQVAAVGQPELRLDTNVPARRLEHQRSIFSGMSPTYTSPISPSSRLLQAVSTFPGLEPEEVRSLVFFCHRTAPEWSGWRDAAFWNRLILQACHLNRSILHGVVALGALHESSEADGESDERSDLQRLALHQSSKASRMAYETAMSDITTLISCVIFICLQNLQDSRTAYQLLKSGHSLITDIDARLASGELVLSDSEKTVLNNLLRPIIERLRMRFCSIVDIPSALTLSAAINRSKTEHRLALPEIPYCFGNLLEGRNKLEEILDWGQENIDSSLSHCEPREQVQALLSNWIAALDDTPVTKLERYEALITSKKLLRAAALVASILYDTLGTSEECHYDRHVDKFAEIIELYHDAIGNPAKSPRTTSFGIDSGVIDTLAFVAGRCRDPIIRRSAIALLAQTNRHEGDLQGGTGSTIMQTLMELEEEGLNVTEAIDVPESRRLRIWEDHQYWQTGEIRILFVKCPYDPSLGAEVKTASVYLPLNFSRAAKEKAAPGIRAGLPNVRYGRGFGAFLEEDTQTYHQITLSSFFMPVPRL